MQHSTCPACGRYVDQPISRTIYRSVNRIAAAAGYCYCCPLGHVFIAPLESGPDCNWEPGVELNNPLA